jgi:iron complex transport system ATP-binding protein
MDEPTSAQDLLRQYEGQEFLLMCAVETGAVVVLALHYLNRVKRSCTSTIAIADGQIISTGRTLETLRST